MSVRWTDEQFRPGVNHVSEHDKAMLLRMLVIVFAFLALVLGTGWYEAEREGAGCFEDEVVVWTGERHDKCVPIDKFGPRD